jgi:peptidoglycan/xylan/chitin deacetylase (PgdA/CDA1 family)
LAKTWHTWTKKVAVAVARISSLPLLGVTGRRLVNGPAALILVCVLLFTALPLVPWDSLIPDIGPSGSDSIDDDSAVLDASAPSPASGKRADLGSASRASSALPDMVFQASHPPNELGGVPILMYHAFTSDPSETDDWTMTLDDFRTELDWLRQNDFVPVPLRSMIDGRFDVPAGKRPVILSFDDSSAGQFGLRQVANGYAVDPDTAIGVLDAYAKQFPEFPAMAFFAVLPFNCFATPGDPSTCEERLMWLYNNGYEIGNHTSDHDELSDVSPDFFTRTIGSMKMWLDERLPVGDGNLSDVLVMPLGAYPDAAMHDDQRAWLADGFWYLGEPVNLALVLEISGGPATPPYGKAFSSMDVFRINAEPELFDYWARSIETGDQEIFVSDGMPNLVTVPSQVADEMNMDRLEELGLELRVIDDGETIDDL